MIQYPITIEEKREGWLKRFGKFIANNRWLCLWLTSSLLSATIFSLLLISGFLSLAEEGLASGINFAFITYNSLMSILFGITIGGLLTITLMCFSRFHYNLYKVLKILCDPRRDVITHSQKKELKDRFCKFLIYGSLSSIIIFVIYSV